MNTDKKVTEKKIMSLLEDKAYSLSLLYKALHKEISRESIKIAVNNLETRGDVISKKVITGRGKPPVMFFSSIAEYPTDIRSLKESYQEQKDRERLERGRTSGHHFHSLDAL